MDANDVATAYKSKHNNIIFVLFESICISQLQAQG